MPQTQPLRTALRIALAATALAALAACNSARDLDQPVEPIGDFYFGHNIVVAENAQRGPLSRAAEPEDWEEALRTEMERRFRRFDGDRLYHLAIGVEGYILAVPGIPLVASPRSALIFSVTVWDDAGGGRINEPHRITVLESVSGGTLVGSGLTRSAEEQMQALSQNAARSIEVWMRQNSAWFEPVDPDDADAVAAREEARRTTAAAIREAEDALLR